ncbi:class I SAM-dependent methyltransferase [Mucilaginibacter sp. SP1R1]|uniref:class I SAM-dependent methyltransferase n=1 Tax=Mucilaginibacter sp. SP1R1 TaxID=2723091 RepID=UPI00160CD051|nr:class I SAM-dependent methyltransferase [Mucilaginibacter sp. SP1R1]MBB6149055.1 ubiquinone/menaquinone biosynthesis C-methylase UbiE [Mucilaginibacter sp. SP1R1]
MATNQQAALAPFVKSNRKFENKGKYFEFPIEKPSEAIKANAYYFNNPEWAEEYLTYCHRSDYFKRRWLAAIGNWDNKVVVDIGCGPGNIYATLKGSPKLIIGVDVASTSLKLANEQGYVSVLADATDLPFISGFADVVTLNAALHHCEDMEAILKEAARIVKLGGLLVTDHDPQLSAWDYKGVAKLLWNSRKLIYRITGRGFHKTQSQQFWGLACEIHHKPGHGVSKSFFKNILEPLNFEVGVYPHNHELGEEVLQGQKGKTELKYRLGNILSGRNPNADISALTLMCLAKRVNA